MPQHFSGIELALLPFSMQMNEDVFQNNFKDKITYIFFHFVYPTSEAKIEIAYMFSKEEA